MINDDSQYLFRRKELKQIFKLVKEANLNLDNTQTEIDNCRKELQNIREVLYNLYVEGSADWGGGWYKVQYTKEDKKKYE